MAKIVLLGINGPIQGTICESSELLRVGRLDALEVVLIDSSVSRYHAEVRHREGGWWLRDLGSTNGTFLNGERLGGERVRIDHGDEVRFGNVAVEVRIPVVGSAEEWDACTHPLSMLESLPHVPWTAPPYHRKLRLWAVDCIRRHGGRCLNSSQDILRRTLNGVEALIDLDPETFERGRLGLLEDLAKHPTNPWNDRSDLSQAGYAWPTASSWDHRCALSQEDIHAYLAYLARNHPTNPWEIVGSVLCPLDASLLSSMYAAVSANPLASLIPPHQDINALEERNALNAVVLRCVLGNPWRPPAIDPSWLVMNDGAVKTLAQTIERNSAFEDMPILADALEEAGCSDERLLGHLRAGVHCRSCHVLDAVLGRPALPRFTFSE